MDLCVIKRGDKYLSYDCTEYAWVSKLESAYIYFGTAQVVADFHAGVMSRCDDYAYVLFMNQGKGNVQVVAVTLTSAN